MTNYNCPQKQKLDVLVEDIKCFQCKKKFITQNFFEWHSCFLKTRGNCSKCGKYFLKKQALFKHYVLCSGKFKAPAEKVKTEGSTEKAPVKLTGKKKAKATKAAAAAARKPSNAPIVKSEVNIGPPPEEAGEFDITFDTFPDNDSDSDEGPSGAALEPEVNLQETPPAVRVKQEKIASPSTVLLQKPQPISPARNQMIRNIKKEKASGSVINTTPKELPTVVNNTPKVLPTLKLKIKGERAEKQNVQYLNPMALKQKPGPKRFKIPQMLAMKIKQEKRDAGYGDKDEEERDEAEPEDEDLLSGYHDAPLVVKIKKEKPDLPVIDKVKKKQLINPMALAGLREKAATNSDTEKNFLVISAVTSINTNGEEEPAPHNDFNAEAEVPQMNDALQSAVPPTNDALQPTVPLTNNYLQKEVQPAMVQIPNSNLELSMINNDCHSSQSADDSAKGADPISDDATPLVNNSDALDALLEKYENLAPPNAELLDELLKFD